MILLCRLLCFEIIFSIFIQGFSIYFYNLEERHEYQLKKPRRKIGGDLEANLVALACSKAPDGRSRWTLRLLADSFVELGFVNSISRETVRRTLKKTKLSLG